MAGFSRRIVALPVEGFEVFAEGKADQMAFDDRFRLLKLVKVRGIRFDPQAAIIGIHQDGAAGKAAFAMGLRIAHLDLVCEMLAQLHEIFRPVLGVPGGD
ncbi:hypothetical protein D3C87_1783970 [compost metagenome]